MGALFLFQFCYQCFTNINYSIILAQNESLAPYYEIDETFFNQKVRELTLRYNYTLNLQGIYEAIKYMYTFWPAPDNVTHIRDQYVHVSIF